MKNGEKAKVIIDNMGPWVQAARAQFAMLERMEAEVKSTKQQLREMAESRVPLGVAGIVEFKGPDGSLAVTIKDPSSDGNRTGLTQDVLHAAEQAGLTLSELTETVEEVKLTGQWVQWFLAAVRAYADKLVPDGWTHKKTVRLSKQGVEALRTLASGKNEQAQALLRAGLMTSSVKETK